MEIVSKCPRCGSPIYGPKTIKMKARKVSVKRTCECHEYMNKPAQPYPWWSGTTQFVPFNQPVSQPYEIVPSQPSTTWITTSEKQQ